MSYWNWLEVIRLFIGIPVDRLAQQHINAMLVPETKLHTGIRWVPEHNRHLTLAFPGNQPEEVIKNLIQALDRAFGQEKAFKTAASTLTRFPSPDGNILALVYKPDAYLSYLCELTQAVLMECNIGFDPKPFRPHITLGRISKAGKFSRTFNQPTNICLRVDRITLFQSTLTDSGSIYLALHETELGHPGDQPARSCAGEYQE